MNRSPASREAVRIGRPNTDRTLNWVSSRPVRAAACRIRTCTQSSRARSANDRNWRCLACVARSSRACVTTCTGGRRRPLSHIRKVFTDAEHLGNSVVVIMPPRNAARAKRSHADSATHPAGSKAITGISDRSSVAADRAPLGATHMWPCEILPKSDVRLLAMIRKTDHFVR